MIRLDEDSLICDLAETYQIYDYKQLPLLKVAVFSFGLKDSSRIKMKMSGQEIPAETLMLASISDGVNTLLWTKTKDATKGRNKPVSLVNRLLKVSEPKADETTAYHSGEDFEKARQALIGGE